MPALANAQHETFCQALTTGRAQADAYEIAGYAGDRSAASRLASRPHIKSRLSELSRTAALSAEVSKAWVMTQLKENALAAMGKLAVSISVPNAKGVLVDVEVRKRDSAAANRALELLGKEMGMFVDRSISAATSLEEMLDRIDEETAPAAGSGSAGDPLPRLAGPAPAQSGETGDGDEPDNVIRLRATVEERSIVATDEPPALVRIPQPINPTTGKPYGPGWPRPMRNEGTVYEKGISGQLRRAKVQPEPEGPAPLDAVTLKALAPIIGKAPVPTRVEQNRQKRAATAKAKAAKLAARGPVPADYGEAWKRSLPAATAALNAKRALAKAEAEKAQPAPADGGEGP